MFRFRIALLALIFTSAQLPIGVAADSTTLGTWSLVDVNGNTVSSLLSLTDGTILSQTISSFDGDTTTETGPASDISGITENACPGILMVDVYLNTKSFHFVSNRPSDPDAFYEDIFFLVFGDAATERQVAAQLSAATNVAIDYQTDCSSDT